MDMHVPTDMMTFLLDEYYKYIKDKEVYPALDRFVDFAREYLAKTNQPVGLTFVATGIALRLQQGETVYFAAQPNDSHTTATASIPITRSKSVPGMHGISDTSGISI